MFPKIQCLDQVVYVHVGTERQVPIIRKVQRTVKFHQVRFIDRIVDLPVVMQRNAPRTLGLVLCAV